jgi:hypothetical protein
VLFCNEFKKYIFFYNLIYVLIFYRIVLFYLDFEFSWFLGLHKSYI